jgi:hypothetical protein
MTCKTALCHNSTAERVRRCQQDQRLTLISPRVRKGNPLSLDGGQRVDFEIKIAAEAVCRTSSAIAVKRATATIPINIKGPTPQLVQHRFSVKGQRLKLDAKIPDPLNSTVGGIIY